MSQFPKCCLADLAIEPLSYGSGASAVAFDGKCRYIRITDLLPDGTLKQEATSPNIFDSRYLLQKGDILFARSGATVGKTYLHKTAANQQCIYAGYLIRLRPDIAKALPRYIFYYTQSVSYKKFVEKNQKVVAQPNINAKQYGALEIPLPPLAEQERIASELDAVVATLKKRQTQLAELDALVEARFVELFGDPATNPKGWPTGTIRDIVSEVKYGTSKPATVDGRFNYLRMNNITYDGYLDLSDLKKIDVPEAEVEKYIVRKNDVLFNRTNSKELVGKTCVFDADEPMIIAGYIIRVRVNEKATPLFLSRFLNSRYGKATLFNMCKAIVGQANINAQELQKIAIFIPPLELQERFAAEVERVEAIKAKVRDGIAETQTLFDALTQKYFG